MPGQFETRAMHKRGRTTWLHEAVVTSPRSWGECRKAGRYRSTPERVVDTGAGRKSRQKRPEKVKVSPGKGRLRLKWEDQRPKDKDTGGIGP